MRRIVIATSNRGKLAEFRQLFAGQPFEIVGLDEYPEVRLPEETGMTYSANAVLKAEAVALAVGEWSLGDDSGLEVDSLGGKPGLYSARFATELRPGETQDAANRRKLIESLRALPLKSEQWTACFVCWLALARPNQHTVMYSGIAEGAVIAEPRGSRGFGYDPLLLLEDLGRTFAELSDVEKNGLSHRGKAVRALLASLA